jgi:hypothetical protein
MQGVENRELEGILMEVFIKFRRLLRIYDDAECSAIKDFINVRNVSESLLRPCIPSGTVR